MRVIRLAMATILCALGATATSAAPIDFSTWTQDVAPSLDVRSGGFKNPDAGSVQTGIGGTATLLSDFVVSGNFRLRVVFSAPLRVDNDPVGVVLGWQDSSNHYRFGMNGFSPRNTGHGYPDRGSSTENGIWLIRETLGTDNVLFNDEPFAYDNTKSYAFVVKRRQGKIVYSLARGGTTLFSGRVFDSTYQVGRIGFYAESMNTLFSNVTFRAPRDNVSYLSAAESLSASTLPSALTLSARDVSAAAAVVPVAPSALFLPSAAALAALLRRRTRAAGRARRTSLPA